MNKIKIPKQALEFIQIYGKSINSGDYIFLPNIYKLTPTGEYLELSLEECPEGIKKYVKNVVESK